MVGAGTVDCCGHGMDVAVQWIQWVAICINSGGLGDEIP
jgi:hypothetical protein